MSINVSGHQVVGPAFADTVAQTLADTDTEPSKVFLEVAESVFFEDAPRAMSALREVKGLGVGLIMDDFGTGYSSLNYLRRSPFDAVKIDRSFIGGLTGEPATGAIVGAIIDLGVDRVQGFFISHPLLAERLEHDILQPATSTPIHLPRGGQATI